MSTTISSTTVPTATARTTIDLDGMTIHRRTAGALSIIGALLMGSGRRVDVATIVIIGLGPVLLTVSNHRTWMPRWLAGAGMACGLFGLISAVSLFYGAAASAGFLIVIAGMFWTIAAGILMLRLAGSGEENARHAH